MTFRIKPRAAIVPFMWTAFVLATWVSAGHCNDDSAVYVGSEACGQCHEQQYESYKAYSKKSSSFESILKMKKGLTETELKECYSCHTTGYGQPGGFQSAEKTPQLKNAGCEVCHGPGSAHAESEDPDDIQRALDIKSCESCHNEERVKTFDYKPLIYGGAH